MLTITNWLLARGIGAGYRSSADSPTALGKGANEDKERQPLFLMVSRPNYIMLIKKALLF
ncbi:hypothetical protein B0A66_06245 [Flavobacterium hercynium]|uniref:Uncharacterized protein n=1 Tax=Flavobacterium hercynium TaxID=387094 RepID=A0A226HJM8_9FLAO|nr:hypothetical protein B0A66_06245 [Flavobacterium hercynium]